MIEIKASQVKELRDKTGAGMMDCKKALTETGGDAEEAVDWLRKKGLAAAAKRAGRAASEGLIGLAVNGKAGAVIEVNAETDFVARNEDFQKFVKSMAEIALDTGADEQALMNAAFPGSGRTAAEELTHMIATIGENMTLRRAAALTVETGVIGSYMHNALAPGLGKIGVLVALEGGATAALEDLGKGLAMHVAASSPLAVSRDDLDPTTLQRERAILADQARQSGKPEEIIEKMVEGRLRKFYEEVCLVDQTYVVDVESKVGEVLAAAAKEAGAAVTVKGFTRFCLGDGIDKKSTDFAAEVASAAGA
ncbi:MAG: translation elongation factor Ts [Rhodospirillales bacterium]|nr:translation elongation factor Ts [Rhodospirillales bacterium]HJN24033.1 translation elongation factor Ts [Rhodospirillales bacterium]